MSRSDPRVLMPRLAGLVDRLAREADAYRVTGAAARDGLTALREHGRRTHNRANQLVDLAQGDERAAEAAHREAGRVHGRAAEARDRAQLVRDNAAKALAEARSRLHAWHEELAFARDWHEQKKLALECAWAEERRAEAAVRAAEDRLSAAQRALESCQIQDIRDSEGNRVMPDCSSEEIRVRVAERDLRDAQAWLARAVQARIEAEEALAQAERRLQRAQYGHDWAGQAVICATNAFERGEASLATAARGVEIAAAAGRLCATVLHWAKEADAKAAEFRQLGDHILSRVDEAHALLYHAERFQEQALRDGLHARKDLEFRIEQLRELNRGPSF